LLCEKVLKRAVDSEQEAQQDKGSAALTPANYKFQLLGSDNLGGRAAYILNVEPLTPSKFLYRGKIWVDAADFAVAKIEAEPAKNPSFWISRTLIHQTYAKAGGFWLPQLNRSETKVRIGGTAVFTIDYGTYQVVADAAHPGMGFPDKKFPAPAYGSIFRIANNVARLRAFLVLNASPGCVVLPMGSVAIGCCTQASL